MARNRPPRREIALRTVLDAEAAAQFQTAKALATRAAAYRALEAGDGARRVSTADCQAAWTALHDARVAGNLTGQRRLRLQQARGFNEVPR